MHDFSVERNNLMTFPQKTFDGAVVICKKTSHWAKTSSPPMGSSTYHSTTPPSPPSSGDTPIVASNFPTTTEIVEARATTLSKVMDLKLGTITSAVGSGGPGSFKTKPRPKCTYYLKDGHLEDNRFKKELRKEIKRRQLLVVVLFLIPRRQ